ncbi:MAG: hypothetical protein QOE36_171 [Gaiellaceae bacterium]|jgi:hypothetical protein|nr:hypothetical protein [Gaiellaceae bacterium]
MARARRKPAPPEVEAGSTDELVRMIALQLKYSVPQAVLIHDLSDAGLGPARIAALLQTTPNTVSKAKRRPRAQWPLK